MSHLTKRLPVLTVAVAVAALLVPGHATAAPPSAAATSTSPGAVTGAAAPLFDPGTGRRFTAVDTARADAVIAAYWTPQRRAAALPVTPSARPGTSAVSDQSAQERTAKPILGDAPAAPTIAGPKGKELASAVNFTQAAGKVFFHDPSDGLDYVCSGGTLNTPKQRIVITAGHCVHGGKGKMWMENWAFYPGYQNGEGAAGHFAAYTFWTTQGWVNDSNFGYDTAFVPTNVNQYGQKLIARVGGNGIIYNPGRPYVTSIGYPTHVGNGGEQQTYCQGQLSRRDLFNGDQKLNCNLRRGASGSAWLKDYDTSYPGLGWAVANYSYFFGDQNPSPAFGPYWDTWTKNLRDTAENSSP